MKTELVRHVCHFVGIVSLLGDDFKGLILDVVEVDRWP